jgi:hypothetical protein
MSRFAANPSSKSLGRFVWAAFGFLAGCLTMVAWYAVRAPAEQSVEAGPAARTSPVAASAKVPAQAAASPGTESHSPLSHLAEALPSDKERRLQRFRQVLAEARPEFRLAAFIALLPQLTEEDFPVLIKEIKFRDGIGETYDREWEQLIAQWGRLAGPRAAEKGFSEFGFPHGNSQDAIDFWTKWPLLGWSEKDPAAAVAWLNSRTNVKDMDGCILSLVEGIAAANPTLATTTLASNLTDENSSSQQWLVSEACNKLSRSAVQQNGLQGVKDWFAAVDGAAQNDGLRKEALKQTIFRLSHASHEQAAEYFKPHVLKPWISKSSLADLMRGWTNSSPAKAEAWLQSQPTEIQAKFRSVLPKAN